MCLKCWCSHSWLPPWRREIHIPGGHLVLWLWVPAVITSWSSSLEKIQMSTSRAGWYRTHPQRWRCSQCSFNWWSYNEQPHKLTNKKQQNYNSHFNNPHLPWPGKFILFHKIEREETHLNSSYKADTPMLKQNDYTITRKSVNQCPWWIWMQQSLIKILSTNAVSLGTLTTPY